MYSRLLLFLIAIFVSSTTLGQSFPSMIEKADSLFRMGLFLESAHCYKRAINSIDEDFVRATDFYNCACSFSLANESSKAFHYLKKAIRKGGVYPKQLEGDKDLINLREKKKWRDLIILAQNKEKKLDKELVEKLKILSKRDQVYRRKIDSLYLNKIRNDSLRRIYSKAQSKIDSLNLIDAKVILDNREYPSRIEIGNLSDVLFLVVQHSNIENMEFYLKTFIKAADSGDLSWQAVALMIDRIRKRKGQKQIYGTQFVRDSNGKWVLYEVEDVVNLNTIRLKIGLSTIEEEIKFWSRR